MDTANNFDAEQFLALGVVGFVILLLGMVLIFAIMAGALKVSINWIGNRTPSYVACVGWIFAIIFVNLFLVFASVTALGQVGAVLATPLTWFATIYMLASAGDCGMLRGFGIWIAQSVLSGIGTFIIAVLMAIPFAMMGAGLRGVDGNLQAQFDEIDAMLEQAEQLDNADPNGPETTPVGFSVEESTNPWMTDDEPEDVRPTEIRSPKTPPAASETSSDDRTIRLDAPQPPSRDVPPKKKRVPSKPQPRRAADGSTLNPFFQQ